jgi:large subunit ribosomal protein L10
MAKAAQVFDALRIKMESGAPAATVTEDAPAQEAPAAEVVAEAVAEAPVAEASAEPAVEPATEPQSE